VFASLSLSPRKGKGMGSKKTGAEAKKYGQQLIWGVSFPVSEPEQSQAMQRCSK